MYKLYVSAVDEFYILRFDNVNDARNEMLLAVDYYSQNGFQFEYDDSTLDGMSAHASKKIGKYALKVTMHIKKELEPENKNVPWRSESK